MLIFINNSKINPGFFTVNVKLITIKKDITR